MKKCCLCHRGRAVHYALELAGYVCSACHANLDAAATAEGSGDVALEDAALAEKDGDVVPTP